jgi:hypothetical protein
MVTLEFLRATMCGMSQRAVECPTFIDWPNPEQPLTCSTL